MSPCLSWGYFLKKLGIRRKRARSRIADAPAEDERQREDLPAKSPDILHVQQLHENKKYNVSLLHTEWRRFPHVPIYGWTNDHEQQLRNLANMIVNGNLESAYYDSEAEYRAARFLNDFKILPGPNVNDINEAVLLLQQNKGFQYNSYCNEGMLEYDADDESEHFEGEEKSTISFCVDFSLTEFLFFYPSAQGVIVAYDSNSLIGERYACVSRLRLLS